MRRRRTNLCREGDDSGSKEQLLGPFLSRPVCALRAARIEGRIWYAALGGKHYSNQVCLANWAGVRCPSGRGDGLPISSSLAGRATSAWHADSARSLCTFSARRSGGIRGFPPSRANPTKQAPPPAVRSAPRCHGTPPPPPPPPPRTSLTRPF